MSKEKKTYEGNISSDYRNKELLKMNIILGLIAFGIILISWLALIIFDPMKEIIRPTGKIPELAIQILIGIIIFAIIIPYTIINLIVFFYLSAYVRRFSYHISDDHILVNHGVFTRTVSAIPYTRIQNINIVNGVFDRMFKTFTVKIETAGSSAAAASAQGGLVRPEGYVPGLKDPHIIEKKIKEMMTKYSAVPSGLEDKVFKPEELAFDNFISYILSKMREGEKLKTTITELREKAGISAPQLAEKVGVPIQTIEYLEEGRYNPSLALAYKIADILNSRIEDLFKLN